jgi:hypothetical protein
MITTVIITNAAMDIAGSMLSYAAIIVTPELLLEGRAQLRQLLSLFLELSL